MLRYVQMMVKQLIEIQKQRGLTDSQFAESLNIHLISWYRNKRTNVIGSDVILRAFEIYPELKESFLSDLTLTPHLRRYKPRWAVLLQRVRITIKRLIRGLK